MSKAKKNLFEHSATKVALLEKYLTIYLNVLQRANFIDKIFLFDLFAGEGIYENGGKGSSIVMLESIKNHHFSNDKKSKPISVVLNDIGKSEIEVDKLKIERVKQLASKIFIPANCEVKYLQENYTDLIKKVAIRASNLKNSERCLIFIDPWGYKEIMPNDLKLLLDNGKTEVILFLPIYFMSRFANKAAKTSDDDFPGGRALRIFLEGLYGSLENVPQISSQKHFIIEIQDKLKEYLGMKYIDNFKIERDGNQWFAIFFFTSSEKGFHKMLEAKWSVDKHSGGEHKIGSNLVIDLFDEVYLSSYDNKVIALLESNGVITNHDLFSFGLENNFLPKHTIKVLKEINRTKPIEKIALDSKAALGYYIEDKERTIQIKFK